MNELEKKIYDKIIGKMDIDETEIDGFDENSPIFGTSDDGKVSLELDSIDSLELVVLIYDEWGIDVPTEDMPKLKTVSSIADYIREHDKA